MKAQSVLSSCVDSYLYAGRKILPDILPYLKSESDISHEQFKVTSLPIIMPCMSFNKLGEPLVIHTQWRLPDGTMYQLDGTLDVCAPLQEKSVQCSKI